MKTILVDAVHTLVVEGTNGFAIDKKMMELLESYDNTKIVVTNASEEKINEFNLHDVSYELFTLEAHPRKTDPSYFVRLIKGKGLHIDNIIYFEHNKDAVSSAQSVGITTYWFDPVIRNLQELKNFLDENII